MKKYLPRYPDCFVCGDRNAIGLKRRFYVEVDGAGDVIGNEAKTDIIFSEEYVGFKGVVHGGVLTALIDETMWWAAVAVTKDSYVTADLKVSFLKPVRIEEEITFRGRFMKSMKKLAICEGDVVNAAGEVFLTAKGRFFRVDEAEKDKLLLCLKFDEDTYKVF